MFVLLLALLAHALQERREFQARFINKPQPPPSGKWKAEVISKKGNKATGKCLELITPKKSDRRRRRRGTGSIHIEPKLDPSQNGNLKLINIAIKS